MKHRCAPVSRCAVTFWISCLVAVAALWAGPVQASKMKITSAQSTATATQKAQWAKLVGKWFGEVEIAGGGKRKWIIERYSNGTYQAHYRVFTEDGQIKDAVEAGHWGVSGTVFFSINRAMRPLDGRFRDTDPADPKYYDAYEIIELTNHVFRFKHAESNEKFEMKKVDDDFELPLRSDFN